MRAAGTGSSTESSSEPSLALALYLHANLVCRARVRTTRAVKPPAAKIENLVRFTVPRTHLEHFKRKPLKDSVIAASRDYYLLAYTRVWERAVALRELQKIYGAYSQTTFWLLAMLISLCSAYLLGDMAINGLGEKRDAFFLILAVAGASVFPLAVWQQVARKRFFTWLESQWENLETGAIHPDGYAVTFDTPLVQYKVVISAILASVAFASRPYVLQHRSAGVVQASFTILSFLFGWWYFGLEGVINTVSAIHGNLRSSDTFTLRELIIKAQNA